MEAKTEAAVTKACPFDHRSADYAADWRNIYASMRGADRLAYTEAHGGYFVAVEYEDVRRILQDAEGFSSGHRVDGGDVEQGIFIPPSSMCAVPVETDGEEHDWYRRILQPWFTPRAAAGWEPFIRDATTVMIDRIIGDGRGDLVLDVTSPVPAIMTTQMFGLPAREWRTYSRAAHPTGEPGDPNAPEGERGWGPVLAGAMSVVAARRAAPRDDLITAIANAQVDGEPVSDERTAEICYQVIAAGTSTTTRVTSEALVWLARNPEARDWLREDPTRVGGAVDEFIRYFSPSHAVARNVTRDVVVHGTPLHRGDRVLVALASANHDDAQFEGAEEIRFGRSPNRQLGFGFGPHHCIGLHLARVMFRVMVQEILARFEGLQIDLNAARRYRSAAGGTGWQSLPVTFNAGKVIGGDLTL